jgi:hypothetical protein
MLWPVLISIELLERKKRRSIKEIHVPPPHEKIILHKTANSVAREPNTY